MTTVLIEKGADGSYSVYTTDFAHFIFGDGTTVAEAKADFEAALEEMRSSYLEKGEQVPQELLNPEFEYKYDIASIFNYINCINVSKFAQMAGINPALMRQYKGGGCYISHAQAKKIERSIHDLGAKLLSISLK